jgi:L-2-hydroxyglutarate oxidase LhgO
MNLNQNVSVALIPAQRTERGYAYIIIDVAGQQTQIFARDKQSADAVSKEMQDFCINYIRDRVELLLGGAPATKEKLESILKDQHEILEKHAMNAKVQQDTNNSWTISFEREI